MYVPEPTGKFVGAPKVPLPVPSRSETSPLVKFVTARSVLPSPLKSPVTTANGPAPTAKSVLAKVTVLHCGETVGAALKLATALAVKLVNV